MFPALEIEHARFLARVQRGVRTESLEDASAAQPRGVRVARETARMRAVRPPSVTFARSRGTG